MKLLSNGAMLLAAEPAMQDIVLVLAFSIDMGSPPETT